MASSIKMSETNPETNQVVNYLQQMFSSLSDNISERDTDKMKIHFTLSRHFTLSNLCKLNNQFPTVPRKLLNCDAYTFFKFLENKGFVDDTNIDALKRTMRMGNPELLHITTLGAKRKAVVDPVVEYLEKTGPTQVDDFLPPWLYPTRKSERIRKKKCASSDNQTKKQKTEAVSFSCNTSNSPPDIDVSPPSTSHDVSADVYNCNHPVRFSCDVKLRVKYEYESHQDILEASVHSNKPQEIARKLDRFNQASLILKARDLGAVVCEIKFSEITSLDAFWRDYINGSLLQALKGVFITEALQQAVGDEPMRLLVTVDEDDYRRGRLKLLQNLTS
ncbi:death effector domain-containing protein-like [Dreissena polymorpha]|uniref:death effector domain-containing protein-like n=1 Tax=Dreissena polymorpha TaxID=45954 RepID=UPI00226558A6|nr:death effector domain-containing protein-like [Dreissena polymorpha]